ncbi:MAG TPA: TonB-dependent receptor [Ideonella sp.]|uniref:TonB-dependent receptor plug domain-containing protein n=1 Tax=Ideonella sp. TaxID=1929293 RepID=UPI002CDC87BB|nr:TonB-dependent receptor [Ideonella sp.]HSI52268.1 TonB-dependent receptor [Ideonella sp.]
MLHQSRAPFALKRLPLALSCGLWLAAAGLHAQTAPTEPTPPAAEATLPAAAGATQKVEINGARISDTEQRRRSTASKIIVGREEIEKFGDSTVGDLLKRLPGVTIGGTPGRGGQIRMRGLGNGYTQILLDGERVQGGLSLDSLDPDQIERIEIIRAPTAETGGRAIGGTINIITREGFTRKLNDLKASVAYENGRVQPQLNWSREDKFEALGLDYNLNMGVNRRDTDDRSVVTTTSPTKDYTETDTSRSQRTGVNLGGKLQWKLEGGDSLQVMPFIVHSEGDSDKTGQVIGTAVPMLPFSTSQSHSDSSLTLGRLNSMYKAQIGDGRLEARVGLGMSRSLSNTHRVEQDSEDATAGNGGVATFDDRTLSRERSASLNTKYSLLLENGHNIVSGLELDRSHLSQNRTQLQDGTPLLDANLEQVSDPGDNLQARSMRTAVYSQDEWTINPNWSAYAGLRWEGIRTHSEAPKSDGSTVVGDSSSSVWTPLLHAVWKPEPKGADQVRMSLTRSYRSPPLANLIASTAPSKHNSETSPDRIGNPNLKPELATGIDLAYEYYLPGGGMLSISAFRRDIQDLMRTVPFSRLNPDGSKQYYTQPQNIGDAMTQGVEIDGKLRLTELWPDAPAVDLRANAALYNSKVKEVPGPNNRLDQQAAGSFNLGGDYKLPGTPLTIGGNFNWQPGYTTRLEYDQYAKQNAKRVVDLYAMYQLSPTARLRLTASNLAPRENDTESIVGNETVATQSQSYLNWRLGLELKL